MEQKTFIAELPFDEIMRRALMVKPSKEKKKSRPKKSESRDRK